MHKIIAGFTDGAKTQITEGKTEIFILKIGKLSLFFFFLQCWLFAHNGCRSALGCYDVHGLYIWPVYSDTTMSPKFIYYYNYILQ